MARRPFPSSVRVLAKSLHLLAAGWIVSVGIVRVVALRNDARLNGGDPWDAHVAMIVAGIVPALILGASALAIERRAHSAPAAADDRREWVHALWWSVLPIVLLLEAVYLMMVPG